MRTEFFVFMLLISTLLNTCLDPVPDDGNPGPGCTVLLDETTVPVIVSAFYGLDDVPAAGFLNADLCTDDGLPRMRIDGMPIVMSVLIDPASLDPSDFEVITESGVALTPLCATLDPANDDCEGRTILLVGDLGSANTDPPILVQIVDELLTLDGRDVRLTAVPLGVTPLVEGPTLVWVEQVNPAVVGAPPGTAIAVRATWDGGIRAADRTEVTPAEWGQYALTLRDENEQEQTVYPFDIGDLNDGDNNQLLFFTTSGKPLTLALPAGLVIDPNGDPNPDTIALVH
jgi:hypothetical protein